MARSPDRFAGPGGRHHVHLRAAGRIALRRGSPCHTLHSCRLSAHAIRFGAPKRHDLCQARIWPKTLRHHSLSFEVCSLCFPFFRYHALARAKLAPDEAVRPAGSRVRQQASVDFKGHTPTQQGRLPQWNLPRDPESIRWRANWDPQLATITPTSSPVLNPMPRHGSPTPTLRTHRTLSGPTRRFCHRRTAHNPTQPQPHTQTVGSQPITQAFTMS